MLFSLLILFLLLCFGRNFVWWCYRRATVAHSGKDIPYNQCKDPIRSIKKSKLKKVFIYLFIYSFTVRCISLVTPHGGGGKKVLCDLFRKTLA